MEEKIIIDDLRRQRPEAPWLWSGGKPAIQFEPVGLHCSPDLRSRVEIFDMRHRFPRGRSFWTRTPSKTARQPYDFVGMPVTDDRRLQITGDWLTIQGLDEADEGVYRFGYEYEPEQFATICFFVVYLQDKLRVVESGRSFTFTCNALGLWPIIQQTPSDGWKTYWSYEPDEKATALGMKPRNKMWFSVLEVPVLSDEGLAAEFENRSTELSLFETEKRRIDEVEYSMSGHYKCWVENYPEGFSHRKFITNSIKLSVISPPTLNDRFIRWFHHNWKPIIILLVVLAFVVIAYLILIKEEILSLSVDVAVVADAAAAAIILLSSPYSYLSLIISSKFRPAVTELSKPPVPSPTFSNPPPPPPSINEFFADIFKFMSLPRLQFPPLSPNLPPLQVPPCCPPTKEVPLDLSCKAPSFINSTSGSAQRKSRDVGVACQHNNHHGHHHHHGSGKQQIPRCFECKRLFPSLWELNTHFLREHQSSLQREFIQNRSWKTCSLENISVQQLQSSLRKGSVERTGYSCPHCDYFAKWPTELQKHIMVHSKERPHQCIICGLTYKWKWDLGRHFDKSHHHAVNPYKKTCLSVKAGRQQQQQKSTATQSLRKKHLQRTSRNSIESTSTLSGKGWNSVLPLPLPNFLPSLSNSYLGRFYGCRE
ncbi:hypothetical protein Aperf_G00000055164 [Anoplocephala perfoliata]